MPFIYSTLTCGNTFAVYAPKTDPNAMSHIIKRIVINGGHGVKNPQGIDTPMGVVTKVTDEELEILQGMLAFKQQVDAGFLVVDNKKVNPARRAAEMNLKDGSAPLTPNDFEKNEDVNTGKTIYKKLGGTNEPGSINI